MRRHGKYGEYAFPFSDRVLDPRLSERDRVSVQTKELVQIHKINKDSLFIDVGSNWGDVLRELVETKCSVLSFEPHPEFAEMLKFMYSSNENISTYPAAVWTKNTVKPLYYKGNGPNLNGGSTLNIEKPGISEDRFVNVQCYDIAQVVTNQERKIDILKLDVEGSEWEILDRLYQTGTYRNVSAIYVEDHVRKIFDGKYRKLRLDVLKNYKEAGVPLYWW